MGGAAFLVFSQNPKRLLNRTFLFGSLSTAFYGAFLAWGINLDPSSTFTYVIWMFNLTNLGIATGFLHFTFVALELDKRFRWVIRTAYAVASIIFIASIIFPAWFIPELTPKLFTVSYLNAGPLYYAMVSYFGATVLIGFITLVRGYVVQKEKRRQIEYFLFAAIFGFGVGVIDFFLVFNIPVSPLYGIFYGLYIVPIAYGILADQLLDIRVVIKKALVYSLGIGGITAVLMLLIQFNNKLVDLFPWVQLWTIPIFTATVSVIVGRIFWNNLIENERVKYEFITVATHKLRTPLTQMNWGISAIREQKIDADTSELLDNLQHSSDRLIELTNMLFSTMEEEDQSYEYEKEEVDLQKITDTILAQLKVITDRKKLAITTTFDTVKSAVADPDRIASVIEVFIENAVNYTAAGGSIDIATRMVGNRVHFFVKDTGIGVSEQDKKSIFLSFYRSDAAKRIDTEGVGLGLSMAQSIIKKHGGKIGVESEGEGLGSVFWFELKKK